MHLKKCLHQYYLHLFQSILRTVSFLVAQSPFIAWIGHDNHEWDLRRTQKKRHWSVLSHCKKYLPLVTEKNSENSQVFEKFEPLEFIICFQDISIQATSFVYLIYQNDIQGVRMIGIQKEKFIFRNLFVIYTSGSHHYKAGLSKVFFADY